MDALCGYAWDMCYDAHLSTALAHTCDLLRSLAQHWDPRFLGHARADTRVSKVSASLYLCVCVRIFCAC